MSKPSPSKAAKRKARANRVRKERHLMNMRAFAWEHLFSAEDHYQRREWQACADSCARALRLDSGSIPAREILSDALRHLGRSAEALDIDRELHNLHPENLSYYAHLVWAELNDHNIEQVVRLTKRMPAGLTPDQQGSLSTARKVAMQALKISDGITFGPVEPNPQAAAGKPKGAERTPPPRAPAHAQLKELRPAVELKIENTVRVPHDAGCLDDSALFWLRQRLRHERVRMQEQFEELFCLGAMRGVEHFGYQVETVRKALRLFRGRVLLADEVGLGKTIEACMILKEYLMRGMVRSVLVLCPPALASQWAREMRHKFDIAAFHLDNPALMRSKKEWFWSRPIVVASIHTAKSAVHRQLVAAREWDMVIVDEAHHLKSRSTLTWKLVNEIRKKFILLLTATPVQNNLGELYNLITLLRPGTFPPEKDFRKTYLSAKDPGKPVNTDKLRLLLRDVMVRNTRAACGVPFPHRYATTCRVEPSPAERDAYEAISALCRDAYAASPAKLRMALGRALERAGSHVPDVAVSLRSLSESLLKTEAPESTILAQLASRANALADEIERIPHDTAKVRQLLQHLSSARDRCLVFCRTTSTVEFLGRRIRDEALPCAVFHAALDAHRKHDAFHAFESGEARILVSSESGGEGHNLQFCNTIVNFDLPWNPMRIEQRIGRVHRIGQNRDVFVFNLCNRNTLEDFILRILEEKVRMFELVIGEADSILGRLEEDGGFHEIVFDLWMRESTERDRVRSFRELGERVAVYREQHGAAVRLDHELFGEDMGS